nr:translation initiation factor IF-2-like [Aegilops tauschii subsp. strangulata]
MGPAGPRSGPGSRRRPPSTTTPPRRQGAVPTPRLPPAAAAGQPDRSHAELHRRRLPAPGREHARAGKGRPAAVGTTGPAPGATAGGGERKRGRRGPVEEGHELRPGHLPGRRREAGLDGGEGREEGGGGGARGRRPAAAGACELD